MNLAAIGMMLNALVLVGAIPVWSYSRNWGYGPSGVIGAYMLTVLILAVQDRI
jgi:uncharacterized protein DUF3309